MTRDQAFARAFLRVLALYGDHAWHRAVAHRRAQAFAGQEALLIRAGRITR